MTHATPPKHGSPIGRLLADLADLSPAYFGMVMATGIVSLAAHLLAWPGIARTLFQLNVVVYAALWLLTMLRAVRSKRGSPWSHTLCRSRPICLNTTSSPCTAFVWRLGGRPQL